jgi:hypothetical protein
VSRITADIFTQVEYPVGRMVMTQHYDSAEKIAEFVMPSLSRSNRVYKIEVDCISLEICCACESALCNLHSLKHRSEFGTELEKLAVEKGYWYMPTITRPYRNLCIHARRVKRWFWRRGLGEMLESKETALYNRLLELPNKRESVEPEAPKREWDAFTMPDKGRRAQTA